MAIATKATADAVVISAPMMASGWRTSASRLVTGAPLLQALHVCHEGIDIGGWQLGESVRHRRLARCLRLRGHLLGHRDPGSDFVSTELLANAIERVGFVPLAFDVVTSLALLRGVHLLSSLHQRRILSCRGEWRCHCGCERDGHYRNDPFHHEHDWHSLQKT